MHHVISKTFLHYHTFNNKASIDKSIISKFIIPKLQTESFEQDYDQTQGSELLISCQVN